MTYICSNQKFDDAVNEALSLVWHLSNRNLDLKI